jgi:hypothetical protein
MQPPGSFLKRKEVTHYLVGRRSLQKASLSDSRIATPTHDKADTTPFAHEAISPK